MARLLQHLLSPFDAQARDARDRSGAALIDDDLALGFECANPALQFEAWEPAPVLSTVTTPSY